MKRKYPVVTLCESTEFKNEPAQVHKAEILAWEQLDSIRHSNGYYDIHDYVYFTHKGKIIVDPWISPETHYDGTPWPDHNNPEHSVDPFVYYGYEKVASFIEEILTRYGEIEK